VDNNNDKGLHYAVWATLLVGLVTLVLVYNHAKVKVSVSESDAANFAGDYEIPPYDIPDEALDSMLTQPVAPEEVSEADEISADDLTASVDDALDNISLIKLKITLSPDPVYVEAPTIIRGKNITPSKEWCMKTPGSIQGECGVGQRLTQVDGPGRATVQAWSTGDYAVMFDKPGAYTLRYTYIFFPTPIDKTRPPRRYLGPDNTFPVYYTISLPPQTLTSDVTVTVLDQSVTTDPKAPTNKDITVNAGKDQSARVKRAMSLISRNDHTYSFVTTRCVGQPKGYCSEYQHAVEAWTKVSGPGSVVFTHGTFRCPTGANNGEPCNTKARYTPTYYPGFRPNSITFSEPGTYVVRYNVYDDQYGYAYDEKTVTVK